MEVKNVEKDFLESKNVFDDLEEVPEFQIKSSDQEIKNKADSKKEKLLIINENDTQSDKNANNTRTSSDNSIYDLEEKQNLISVFKKLEDVLNKADNKPNSIDEIYESLYLDNEYLTNTHLRKNINKHFLRFIFFIEGPIYGIVFLTGIFEIKSVMNALFEVIKESSINYFKCKFGSNCNITLRDDGTSVYDFYNFFYSYTKNETIDFNLMMMTGFIGSIFLNWIGFRISSGILSLFNFGSIFWLLNFDFNFSTKGEFDYDILKILNLVFIYILLLIGIGSSALLSHQILIDSHLKYKFYIIKRILDKYKPSFLLDEEEENELDDSINSNKDNNFTEIKNQKKTAILIKSTKTPKIPKTKFLEDKEKNEILPTKTFYLKKTSKDILIEEEKKEQKRREEKLKKRIKNKFDFFFMICLTTIIGYLLKYGMNFLLDKILVQLFGQNYNKRIFLIATGVIYCLSLIFSMLLYKLYKVSILEDDMEKKKKKKKEVKITQLCGYIIYSEKRTFPKRGKNCCTLCCESVQNCCNETYCSLLKEYCKICGEEPHCSCSCCEYNEQDYSKRKEVFRYCYKTQRKSLWCNRFFTNKTQHEIFPYMLEYFILQLTTIGFEKQYEKYKNKNVHIKTWTTVFISTFILFFYFTLSFTRLIKKEKKEEEEQEEKDLFKDIYNDIEKGSDNVRSNELITKLSNEILKGTHAILLFNGVFSLIFSGYYLTGDSNNFKNFFFEDNINIIFMPILMNKFYYFTLNYYCIYTAEENKKFELISASSLISVYIALWNLVLIVIKSVIPDEDNSDNYNYYNILYIIQLSVSFIPSVIVAFYILCGLIMSSKILDLCEPDVNCQECKQKCRLHRFLCWLCSCILCFGGLWIKMTKFIEYQYECCTIGECCDIGDYCCLVYCSNNTIYCKCCCCDKNNKQYYKKCCEENCATCRIWGCNKEKEEKEKDKVENI